jgi:PIN domain nuclease of toxin-antitoxin system
VGSHEVIVADTHALIWWITDDARLSVRARETMSRRAVGIAVITCWEIALLSARGRIALDTHIADWWHDVMSLPETALLPLTIDVAAAAASLTDPIRDPADRLIVATALLQGVPLVTKDERIRASGVVETIW